MKGERQSGDSTSDEDKSFDEFMESALHAHALQQGRISIAITMHRGSRLVVDALELAVQRRLPGEGLLSHSDRGSQYASAHYQGLLARPGMPCSMSRRTDCWDNAPMESFFASLKKELIHGADLATRTEARAAIFESIEVFYNNQRRPSSLGYVSPAEYEQSAKP